MSHFKIKTSCLDSRVITVKQWHQQFAHLDELIRPVVLRINDAHGLVTIRPRRADEILKIKKQRGLPLTDEELVTRSGSLVDDSRKLVVEDNK